jgi:hypothetical protein
MGYTNVELPDLPGIWTSAEDKLVYSGDARTIEKLDEKHGYGMSGARKVFLQVWNKTSIELAMRKAKWPLVMAMAEDD